MSFEIILSALIIMLASLAGVFFVNRKFGEWMKEHLAYLVTFAAGVFIITSYNLVEEAVELSGATSVKLFAGVLLGMVVLEVGSRMFPEMHHHHEADHPHEHTSIDARRVLFSDAIHNIGDGILLVPSFIVDIRVGLAAAAAIFLHELVQEISEFFVLKSAGYSTMEALLRNFAVSSTIFIGIGLSVVLTSAQHFVGPLIAFAAGGFIYIVFRDLLPSTFESIRQEDNIKKHLLALFLGIAVMFAVNVAIPHAHGPEEDHENGEQISLMETGEKAPRL